MNKITDGTGELRFHALHEADEDSVKYAVIIARHRGKWVFCKNKVRKWEVPGGHREAGEDILETAKRELTEETGAIKFEITPVCAYSINSVGVLFFAEVEEFGTLPPDSEIEKIDFFDSPPNELTFPQYHPKMLAKVREVMNL